MKINIRIPLLAVILSAALLLPAYSADTSGMELVSETDSFRFYARDGNDYSIFTNSLDEKSGEFEELFQKRLAEKVDFYIYPDRKIFFKDVLHCDEPFGTTTAMADHVSNRIYLTSPYDPEVKDLGKDMRKVAVHELVHLYFPSEYIFIREGTAEYFSGRLVAVQPEELPYGFHNIRFYVDGPDETRKAYNLSGWMMKFIIEECLDGGLEKELQRFKLYCAKPDDYTVIGFKSESDFFEDFRAFLELK